MPMTTQYQGARSGALVEILGMPPSYKYASKFLKNTYVRLYSTGTVWSVGGRRFMTAWIKPLGLPKWFPEDKGPWCISFEFRRVPSYVRKHWDVK